MLVSSVWWQPLSFSTCVISVFSFNKVEIKSLTQKQTSKISLCEQTALQTLAIFEVYKSGAFSFKILFFHNFVYTYKMFFDPSSPNYLLLPSSPSTKSLLSIPFSAFLCAHV